MWTKKDLLEAVRNEPTAAAAALDSLPWGGGVRLQAHALRAAALAHGDDPATHWVKQLEQRGLLDAFARALQSHGVVLEKEPEPSDDGWLDHIDPEKASTFLLAAASIRCRVFVNDVFKGTGCLVGPGLVMTAWHVVAVAPPGQLQEPLPEIKVQLSDGSFHLASVPPQFASQCSPEEFLENAPRADAEVAGAHDVALLSLRSPAARHLGFAKLPRPAPPARSRNTVILAHFPEGLNQGLGVGRTSKIRSVSARLRHNVRTSPGSSGGACFNNDTELLGVHQGVWQKKGLLVPLETFIGEVVAFVDKDIAPRTIWRLDDAAEHLVVGRDLFADAIGAAGEDVSRVRGAWVKRSGDAAAVGSGLGYSFEILRELLLRRGAEQLLVRLPDLALVPDVLTAIWAWATDAGLQLPPMAAPQGSGSTEAAPEATARATANLLALALNNAAEKDGRTVWFFVDNPSENHLVDPSRLALEAFVAAVLAQPRLRIVLAGLEGILLAGQQFPDPGFAAGPGAPGLVVEFVGTFTRNDVLNVLTEACEELTGTSNQAEVGLAADRVMLPLKGRDKNGFYQVTDLPKVLEELHMFVETFRARAPGGQP